MKPKTPEELREKCQRIANETGCVVTVDNDGGVYQWRRTVKTTTIMFVEFCGLWLLKRKDIRNIQGRIKAAIALIYPREIKFEIPDPENWLFVTREEA